MSIEYVKGDATQPRGKGNKIIVHICNDLGLWGRGFVLAVSRRWPKAEREYRSKSEYTLGDVQFVLVEPNLWIANLIGQRGIKGYSDSPPIRYESVRNGLSSIAKFAKENKASIHMPRIGCGLAGGKWETISDIIESELTSKGIPVTVYDL